MLDLISIEAVHTEIWLLPTVIIAVLAAIVVYVFIRKKKIDDLAFAFWIGICFVGASIALHYSYTNALVEYNQNVQLEAEFGLTGIVRDGSAFVASQDGEYVSGQLIGIGNDEYVVRWDDNKQNASEADSITRQVEPEDDIETSVPAPASEPEHTS